MDDAARTQARIPTADELVARARAFVPVLRERGAETERNRGVSLKTVQELNDAGLFRVMQPKRWEGYELGLKTANDIQMILAEGCLSTGWVYAVLAVEPFLLGLCDDRMAADVWRHDTSTLVSGTSAAGPGVKAERVEGGFRIGGRWRFASGCDHTDWIFLGAPTKDADGTAENWRFLLPRADYEISDTWFVSGLKGSGSRDIVVEDKFIPDYRAIRQHDMYMCRGAGQAVNTGALYRIPFGQIFAMSVSTIVIGGLQGMLDEYLAYGRNRIARGIGATAQDPVAQLACAEAASIVDEYKTLFDRNIAALTEYAERGEIPPLTERMRFKFQLSYAVERASLVAHRLYKAAGATGIYTESSPLARWLADIDVGRQHVSNQFEASGRNWGRMLLGGDEKDNRDRIL